jgi:hypothetical protein
MWQQTLYVSVTKSGVLQCKRDGIFCLIVCWSDDLCVVSDNEEFRTKLEECLKKRFITNCLGELSHSIGIVLKKEKDGFSMHQSPCNKRVCDTYPHGRNSQAQVPASSKRLSKIDCPTTDEEKVEVDYPCINVTGSLLYTTIFHKT